MVNAFSKETSAPAPSNTAVYALVDILQLAYSNRIALTVDIPIKDNESRQWKAIAWKEVCKDLSSIYNQPVEYITQLRDFIKIRVMRNLGIIVFRITADGNSQQFRQFYETIQ